MPRKRSPFIRHSAVRDAKLIIIASEDSKATVAYFEAIITNYQKPKIHVEILKRDQEGNSSPDSVLREADNWVKTYQIGDDDELWLVIDVDRWGSEKLSQISQQCLQKKISLAVSNPTIELWFLLHRVDISKYPNDVQKELLENGRVSSSRKRLEQEIINVVGSFNKSNLNVNDYIPHVENAIHHADLLGISPTDRWPQTLGTQVHLLMKSILGLKDGEVK